MRKALFFIRTTWAMVVAHKIRFVLVCIGVFIGVFVFSVCSLLVDSFYTTQMKEVNSIPENALAIVCASDENDIDIITKHLETSPVLMTGVSPGKQIIFTQLPGDRMLTVNGNVYGIKSPLSDKGVAVSHSKSNQCIPVNFRIVKGRNIVYSDIVGENPVVIIDEFTERLLFEDGNAIGKTIHMTSNAAPIKQKDESGYHTLTVVGVCKNTYYSEANMQKLREDYYKTDFDIYIGATVYVPCTLLEHERNVSNIYLFPFESAGEYREALKIINSINQVKQDSSTYLSYTSKETLYDFVNSTLLPMKALFNIILAVTLIISGLLIMSIILFSIKERIPEIGIRKAFGASNCAILIQYITEILVIALLMSVLAFWASYGFVYTIRDYISDNLFVAYELSWNARIFLRSLIVGVLQSAIFAAIPCISAARVQVVRALKFD